MFEHDLLIIGAGLAGLRAAVEGVRGGADVAVITKVHPVRSHSNAAQGGINAPLTDRGDDWEGHALDTIKGSDYLADQDAVELMSREAGKGRNRTRTHGRDLQPRRRRKARHTAVRRPKNSTDLLRWSDYRVRDVARALRAGDQVRPARVRRVVRHIPHQGGR